MRYGRKRKEAPLARRFSLHAALCCWSSACFGIKISSALALEQIEAMLSRIGQAARIQWQSRRRRNFDPQKRAAHLLNKILELKFS